MVASPLWSEPGKDVHNQTVPCKCRSTRRREQGMDALPHDTQLYGSNSRLDIERPCLDRKHDASLPRGGARRTRL